MYQCLANMFSVMKMYREVLKKIKINCVLRNENVNKKISYAVIANQNDDSQ